MFVRSRSTTLEFTILSRLLTSTARLMVTLVCTLQLFASRRLTFGDGVILSHILDGIKSCRMKLDPISESNTTTYFWVALQVIPFRHMFYNFVFTWRGGLPGETSDKFVSMRVGEIQGWLFMILKRGPILSARVWYRAFYTPKFTGG